MTKTNLDPTTDPECQQFLADLRALAERARNLKRRLDRECCAIGTAWGITRGLDAALARAEAEIAPETTPAE